MYNLISKLAHTFPPPPLFLSPLATFLLLLLLLLEFSLRHPVCSRCVFARAVQKKAAGPASSLTHLHLESELLLPRLNQNPIMADNVTDLKKILEEKDCEETERVIKSGSFSSMPVLFDPMLPTSSVSLPCCWKQPRP
jgi:hypothetical protein